MKLWLTFSYVVAALALSFVALGILVMFLFGISTSHISYSDIPFIILILILILLLAINAVRYFLLGVGILKPKEINQLPSSQMRQSKWYSKHALALCIAGLTIVFIIFGMIHFLFQ